MSNPNDPFPVPPEGAPPHQPQGGVPPQPHHPPQPPLGGPQPPYGGPPQPPYPGQPRGNNKLLLGIIAGLLLIIIVGAGLYFAGVFGGKGSAPSSSSSGSGSSSSSSSGGGAAVPVTRDAVLGVWSETDDCGFQMVDLKSDGTFYRSRTDTKTFGDRRQGTWRLEGNRLITQDDPIGSTVMTPETLTIDEMTTDSYRVSVQRSSGPAQYVRVRCNAAPAVVSTAAAPAPAPTVSGNSSASSAPNLRGRIENVAGQIQRMAPARAGPITLTGATAYPTELIVLASHPSALNDSAWTFLANGVRQEMCRSPAGDIVREGGAVSIQVIDSTGRRWVENVTRC